MQSGEEGREGRKKTSRAMRKDEIRRNIYPGVKEIMEGCTKGGILEDILRKKEKSARAEEEERGAEEGRK